MRTWLAKVRQVLPRRRRRLWRYVSGRRHGVGVAVAVLLVLVACGYWYLTNEQRVEGEVSGWLEGLTGGRTRIEGARFSLFGEIEVRNLRLYLGEEVPVPFFEAPLVRLGHNPLSVLLRGRVEPTEIVCINPRVTLVQDAQTGAWNAQRIFPLAGGEALGGRRQRLPAIRLREGRLRTAEISDGQLIWGGESPLAVTLEPDASGRVYALTFEEQTGPRPVPPGTGTVDTASGQTEITGWLGLEGLDRTLTRKYRQWLQRYRLSGQVEWNLAARLGTSPATAPGQLDRLTVTLKDVAMELPPEEGGLKVSDVNGTLVFDPSGISLQRLSGRIAGTEKGSATLSGRYEGFAPNSPFALTLEVEGLTLPLDREVVGVLGERLKGWHEEMAPAGAADLSVRLARDPTGRWSVTGTADLRGLTVLMPEWPIEVRDVTGGLLLEQDRLTLRDLRGVHRQQVGGRVQESPMTMTGRLEGLSGSLAYDLEVTAADLPFSADLRRSIPAGLASLWDALSPQGQATFTARVRKEAGQESSTNVTIALDGGASMEFSDFPYRLHNLQGRMVIAGGVARIESVRGSNGAMRCTLDGSAAGIGQEGDFDLTIRATDLPLDDHLAGALWGDVRRAYEACGFTGRADVTEARVWERKGGRVGFDIRLALKDAGIRLGQFPYPIEHASGTLRVTRDQATIERLVGQHGPSVIAVQKGGRIALSDGLAGVDMTLTAHDLTLDEDLRAALPEDARRTWDALSPSGRADVTVSLRTGTLAAGAPGFAGAQPGSQPAQATTAPASAPGGGAMDYRLVIQPRDARILYRRFPYPLRQVTGQVTVVPGLATLEDLTGLAGSSRIVLNGRIGMAEGREWADLSVSTPDPVPLDKDLLAALPEALVAALGLHEGGTVDLKVDRFRLWTAGAPVPWGAPATQPAQAGADSGQELGPPAAEAHQAPAGTQPGATTRPAGDLAWSWSGRVALQDVSADLGLDIGHLTGSIEGRMSCDGPMEALQADARVRLSRAAVGPRELTELSAVLAKDAASQWLRINDLGARTCGGRLGGFAEVRLARPIRYGLSLSVESIDLDKFFNAGRTEDQRIDTRGVLSGKLQFNATAGDNATRVATGRMAVGQARMDTLPVVLGLLNVVPLSLPDSPFQGAEFDYYLRADTLVFREIYLQGSGVSMMGSGKMDLKSEKLDLTFLAGRRVPRLDALGEMLQALAGELMTVRVTGTLGKPRKQTIPLHSLDETLKELLSPASR